MYRNREGKSLCEREYYGVVETDRPFRALPKRPRVVARGPVDLKETMSTNAISGRAGVSADQRRAEWERFSMTVLDGDGAGYINVRNDSHEEPGEHIYSVHVVNGQADGCSCPHAAHRGAYCKHQRAVEQRPLVLSSANAASAQTPRVAADGGEVVGQ